MARPPDSSKSCSRRHIGNRKVILLVDEYDKPMIDNIGDLELAQQMRLGLVSQVSGCQA